MRSWVASVGVAVVLVGAGIGLAASPAKPLVTQKVPPSAGVVDLGKLAKPRLAMHGKVYDLAPGGTLRVVVGESKGEGLGPIATLPKAGGVTVKRTILGMPTSSTTAPPRTDVEYRFSLPSGCKPGRYAVRMLGATPQGAVAFVLRVKAQRAGEPRAL